jgi:hypothetical protein
MTKIDKADLERVISRIKKFPKPTPRPLVQRAPISKHRLAAAKMLEATLAKAGLDVAKFDKLMAQDRREARAFLKKDWPNPQQTPERQQKPRTDSAPKHTLRWESCLRPTYYRSPK